MNWFWLQCVYDFTAVDDCEGLSLPDEKIGAPPNAVVLSLFQMFFVRENPAKNPIERIGSPSFCTNFQRMAVIARSRDFDSL